MAKPVQYLQNKQCGLKRAFYSELTVCICCPDSGGGQIQIQPQTEVIEIHPS